MDISFVPFLKDGEDMDVRATTAHAALKKVALEMGHDVVTPSSASSGSFLRSLAIVLEDSLLDADFVKALKNNGHFLSVQDFLDGVDVSLMRQGGEDRPGLNRMIERCRAFVKGFVEKYDNVVDAHTDGNDTFGNLFLRQEDSLVPVLLDNLAKLRETWGGAAAVTGTDEMKQEAELVLHLLDTSLVQGTAESGAFTRLITALMLGVDVYMYTAER